MVFPAGTKIVTLGDSGTEAGSSASASMVYRGNLSIIGLALQEVTGFDFAIWYDSTRSPTFSGCNFGKGGDSATMLLNRLPSAIRSAKKMDAKVAVLAIGTNTGTTDTPLSMKKTRIRTIVGDLTSSGITVVLATIRPRMRDNMGYVYGVTREYLDTLIQTNDFIKTLAADNVLIWDAWEDLRDHSYAVGHDLYGVLNPEYTNDGAHLSQIGTYVASRSLVPILSSLVEQTPWQVTDPSHASNRITVGKMAGSSGTVGAGLTGQAPTGYVASITSPVNVSGAIAVTPNSETGGNNTVVTLTSDGAGANTSTERFSLAPLSTNVNEPAITNGKYVRMWIEYEAVNSGALNCVALRINNETTAMNYYGGYAISYLSTWSPLPIGTFGGWLCSEPIKYNTSDVLSPSVQIDTLKHIAGTHTVTIKRVLLLEEESPLTKFPYISGASFSGHSELLQDFAGVDGQLQCMGTSWSSSTYPDGVAGSMEIVDGWFKGTIRQTDPATFSGIRSEIIPFSTQALGDEIVFTWEMLIKSSEWPDHSGDIVLGQLHTEDTIVAAVPFAISAKGGTLFFDIPNSEPPTESLTYKRNVIGDLRLDHIYKMAVRMRCINNTTGYLQAFVDGVQVYYNWQRGTNYNADAPYFKLGIYDGPHLANFGTKSARFRNVRRYTGVDAYSLFLGNVPLPPKRMVGVL